MLFYSLLLLFFGTVNAGDYLCSSTSTVLEKGTVTSTKQIRDPDYGKKLSCAPGDEQKDHVIELNLLKFFINNVHGLGCDTIAYLNDNRGEGGETWPVSCVATEHNQCKGKLVDKMIKSRSFNEKLTCDSVQHYSDRQGRQATMTVLQVFGIIDAMFQKIFNDDADYLAQDENADMLENLRKLHLWWDSWASDWGCNVHSDSRIAVTPHPMAATVMDSSRPRFDEPEPTHVHRKKCRTPSDEMDGVLTRGQYKCIQAQTSQEQKLRSGWILHYLTDPNAHLNSHADGTGPHITCRSRGTTDFRNAPKINMALGNTKENLYNWVQDCCPVDASKDELRRLIDIAKDKCGVADLYD